MRRGQVAPAVIGVLAPMPSELRAVGKAFGARSDVVTGRTGMGPVRAAEATARFLEAHPVELLVVCGIAGGVRGVTAVRDLVVPEAVVDGATGSRYESSPPPGVAVAGTIRTDGLDAYEVTPEAIAGWRAEGIVAVDMETAGVARVCAERGVPWMAFRGISDLAGDESIGPVVMTLVDEEGRPKVGAGLAFLLRHPRRVPRFVRLARDAEAAATIAAQAARQALLPRT